MKQEQVTYQGRPCKRCYGTLRYKSNRTCVSCSKMNVRKSRKQVKETYEGQKTYEGNKCNKCGTTEKYVSVNLCVVCTTAAANKRNRRLKED